MKILIADDSRLVRERLRDLLVDVEHLEVVGQARDAVEARELTRKLKPDVLILDLRMPKGSGANVLADIKKSSPAPKVIMLTNYAYPENREKCMDRGADFFFDKSTELEQVISVLKNMAAGCREQCG